MRRSTGRSSAGVDEADGRGRSGLRRPRTIRRRSASCGISGSTPRRSPVAVPVATLRRERWPAEPAACRTATGSARWRSRGDRRSRRPPPGRLPDIAADRREVRAAAQTSPTTASRTISSSRRRMARSPRSHGVARSRSAASESRAGRDPPRSSAPRPVARRGHLGPVAVLQRGVRAVQVYADASEGGSRGSSMVGRVPPADLPPALRRHGPARPSDLQSTP